ncbi:hypothetical protein FQN51_009273 [Onygenales sp. PD_10]|nr:hypothetical protein FQN51_009273 [Onygenales sp. PD_10]
MLLTSQPILTASNAVQYPAPPSPSPSPLPHLVSLANIDPAILDEGTLVSLNLAQADIDSLESAVLPDASEAHTADADEEDRLSFNVSTGDIPPYASEEMLEEARQILLGPDGYEGSLVSTTDPHAAWINGYSKYNVVKNQHFELDKFHTAATEEEKLELFNPLYVRRLATNGHMDPETAAVVIPKLLVMTL